MLPKHSRMSRTRRSGASHAGLVEAGRWCLRTHAIPQDALPHISGVEGLWLLRARKELIPSGTGQYVLEKSDNGEQSKCAR